MIQHPIVVAGARPNFPKVAPLMRAFGAAGIEAGLVHTGQHYDAVMSESFFESLSIPEPIANLGIGSGSHAAQTAGVMVAFESFLLKHEVDSVFVVGDVNSTVACALVAAKAGLPIGHVEAGLRSFDRSMPEEINRIVVDSLATWLFTPSKDADENLLADGVEPSRIWRVGNIMVDSLLVSIDAARLRPVRTELGLWPEYGLVTLHRPALVDNPQLMTGMMATLAAVSRFVPLVFPMHPRTKAMIEQQRIDVDPERLRILEPLTYLDFLALEASAALVITDSGGVQEETSVLGIPCLTVRENTERPITITEGTNTLVGFDQERIVAAARTAMKPSIVRASIDLWDGKTSERIIDALLRSPSLAKPSFVPPSLAAQPSPEMLAGRTSFEPSPHHQDEWIFS